MDFIVGGHFYHTLTTKFFGLFGLHKNLENNSAPYYEPDIKSTLKGRKEKKSIPC
jgi:hypothetical protein